MSRLEPHESLLVGHWIEKDGEVVGDDACLRIDVLLRDHLQKIATSSDGWRVLFRDPNDGRLWELSYPHSGWHGGGPPKLELLSPESAKQLYGLGG